MTLNTIMTLSKITHAIGKITLPQIYLKGAVTAGDGFCGLAECFGGLLFTFCSDDLEEGQTHYIFTKRKGKTSKDPSNVKN